MVAVSLIFIIGTSTMVDSGPGGFQDLVIRHQSSVISIGDRCGLKHPTHQAIAWSLLQKSLDDGFRDRGHRSDRTGEDGPGCPEALVTGVTVLKKACRNMPCMCKEQINACMGICWWCIYEMVNRTEGV